MIALKRIERVYYVQLRSLEQTTENKIRFSRIKNALLNVFKYQKSMDFTDGLNPLVFSMDGPFVKLKRKKFKSTSTDKRDNLSVNPSTNFRA